MRAQSNNTKAKAKTQSTTLQYLFELDSNNENENKQVTNKNITSPMPFSCEYEEIISTISYCTGMFTFTDPNESPFQQALKKLKLSHLFSNLKSSTKFLHDDEVLSALMSMISINLFRPLSPPTMMIPTTDLPDDEDPISIFSPMWSHLQLVYDILILVVINIDPNILKHHIDNQFLLNLLSVFQSEDPRERESLKNVYHRIYSGFWFHRSFMRKSMNDVFLHYTYEAERHCGIGELLEIWGSIINGFTIPLKEEHKLFLMRVLIPLHKTKGMQVYHRQLAYCVSQFVQKEPVLGGVVVRGILKYWPVTNCQKEILFIGELEELVESIDPDQYRKLALPMCTQITKCINSWNSQVAECALYVWNNEQFVKMASMEIEQVFPIVVEGLEKNLKWHWSKSVRQLTQNVKTMMLDEMDPLLYSKCLEEIDRRETEARQADINRKEKWEKIERAAARNHHHRLICV